MSDVQTLTDLYVKPLSRETTSSRADVSRQQILTVAARLLRERGYAETSLRDIAAAVGMKAGSLYYHFESKELLVSEILRIGMERAQAALVRCLASLPPDASHRERICAAITTHLETLLAESDFASAHIRCFPYAPRAVKESVKPGRRAYGQLWSQLFEAAAQDGALRAGMDPRIMRLAIFGALNSSLEWFDPARDEPHKIAQMLCGCFLRDD